MGFMEPACTYTSQVCMINDGTYMLAIVKQQCTCTHVHVGIQNKRFTCTYQAFVYENVFFFKLSILREVLRFNVMYKPIR